MATKKTTKKPVAKKKDGRSTKSEAHKAAISAGLKRYWAKQKKRNPNAGKLTEHGKKMAAERRAANKAAGTKPKKKTGLLGSGNHPASTATLKKQLTEARKKEAHYFSKNDSGKYDKQLDRATTKSVLIQRELRKRQK